MSISRMTLSFSMQILEETIQSLEKTEISFTKRQDQMPEWKTENEL